MNIAKGKGITIISLVIGITLVIPVCHMHAADTIKVDFTYKHKINDQHQTYGYVTISQKFHTPDDTILREVRYDETTGQISGYTFYFYRNNRLFSEECYHANDTLDYVLRHQYDDNGNNTLTTRLIRISDRMVRDGRTVRKFNDNKQIIKKKVYIGNKLGANISYVYDDEGKLTIIKGRYKSVYDTSIIQEEKACIYDTADRISNVIVTGKDISDRQYEQREQYEYDDQGMMTRIKIFDHNDILLKERIFRYHPSGTLSEYHENNSEGKIILLLQYETKKRFMNLGTQRSVLIH